MTDATIPALMVGAGVVAVGLLTLNFLQGGHVGAGADPGSSGRTNDWSTTDLDKLLSFCDALAIGDCTIPLRVWANESDNKTTAHNPNGNASGLFQLMPETARGLGWDVGSDPDLAQYRQLSVSEQLDWALRYYAPHKGELGTVGRFYVANFLPALLSHADDLQFDLTDALGPTAARQVYTANLGFDHDGKGFITVQDLVDASARATGPRTNELIARLLARLGVA